MRNRVLLVFVAALGALSCLITVSPAHASYYGGGVTCGMAAVPTAAATGGTTYVGVVSSGPWALPGGYWGGEATSVTVTCRVQIDDPSYGGTGQEVSTTFDGFAGGLAERTVTFEAGPASKVYLCTTVSWTGNEGDGQVNVDFGTLPGEQCATTIGWIDETTTVVIPPQPLTFNA